MSALDKEPFPRGALIGVGALIAVSLGVTAVGRLERLSASLAPPEAGRAAPVKSAAMRFVDMADGAVSVRDAASGREIARLAPGTNGFVRTVMRGLVRDRKLRRIGPEAPFRLSSWSGRRLTVEDPATGRTIDLDAFGPSNKDDFARLLNAEAAS